MKKKNRVLICTCIISFWWNLSAFLTEYVHYPVTVDNAFLNTVCVVLAQGGIDMEGAVMLRMYSLPILFMFFACVSAICLRRTFSGAELTAYLLPPILAGIPALACVVIGSAFWFEICTTAYVGALYLLWLIVCITLLILSKRKQQNAV